jgi:hypothetical protein
VTPFSRAVSQLEKACRSGVEPETLIRSVIDLPWHERSEQERKSWRTRSDDRSLGHSFKKVSEEIVPIARLLQCRSFDAEKVHFPMDSSPGCDAIIDTKQGNLVVEVTRADDGFFCKMQKLNASGHLTESYDDRDLLSEIYTDIERAISQKTNRYSKLGNYPDVLLMTFKRPGDLNNKMRHLLRQHLSRLKVGSDFSQVLLLHNCSKPDLFSVTEGAWVSEPKHSSRSLGGSYFSEL